MKIAKDRKGVTFIELLVALGVFSVIMVAVYSVFNSFVRIAATERKITKTEIDTINVVWPIIKEIQSAGLGTPDDPTIVNGCFPAITVDMSGVLTIHSTAAGDSQYAGKWSYIENDCSVTGFQANDKVVIINSLDKSRVDTGTINTILGVDYVDATCDPTHTGHLAFWYDSTLECYETSYSLRPYASGTEPKMCAPNTSQLSRRVVTTAGNAGTFQPMLDCVLDVTGRFGCVEPNGDITWQPGSTCTTGDLLFLRLGIILQSSSWRELLSSTPIILFEDLGSTDWTSVTLTSAQQNYKWKKIDETILLKNTD